MKHKKLQRKTQDDSGGDAAISDCDSSRQYSPMDLDNGHMMAARNFESSDEIDVVSDDDVYARSSDAMSSM